MKMKCYVTYCQNHSPREVKWWDRLLTAILMWDWNFYVCPTHYNLFEVDD